MDTLENDKNKKNSNDIFKIDTKGAAKRNKERLIVQNTLKTIIDELTSAEKLLSNLSVFNTNNLLHLIQSKVELLNILKNLESEKSLYDKNSEVAMELLEESKNE